MKSDKLVDAIGMIDDTYIEEAHSPAKKKKKFQFELNWALTGKILAGAMAVLLAITILPSLISPYKESSYYYEQDYKGDSAPAASPSYASGGASYTYSDQESMMVADEAKEEPMEAGGNYEQANNNLRQNKKLILTASMNLETQDLDTLLEKILSAVSEEGGYVQSSSTGSRNGNNRYYSATIRIPAQNYDAFLAKIKESGNTTYYSQETKDVTDSYTDIEARLTSLKAQEAKVLEFYDKAETIEDLMAVESRLSDIRYEIEYYEAQIKNYDLLVSYSTLNLTVNETKVYTPVSQNFFARLGRSFTNGFSNFVDGIGDFIIDIVYNMWTILLLIALGFGAYKLYKFLRNRKKA